jgi:hypothetical protein
LRLTPGSVEILRRRARAYYVWGRLACAQRDLELAARLEPDADGLAEERLRLRLLTRRGPAVEDLLRTLSPAAARFWRGYRACRQGRFTAAAEHFRSVAGREREGPPARAAMLALPRCPRR